MKPTTVLIPSNSERAYFQSGPIVKRGSVYEIQFRYMKQRVLPLHLGCLSFFANFVKTSLISLPVGVVALTTLLVLEELDFIAVFMLRRTAVGDLLSSRTMASWSTGL
jgi:hypothetical protein